MISLVEGGRLCRGSEGLRHAFLSLHSHSRTHACGLTIRPDAP
jgi:hypothetical protein